MIFLDFFSSNIVLIILGFSVLGLIILFVFRFKNENKNEEELKKHKSGLKFQQKKGMDINLKMQAYERLTIFLERTDPWRLLVIIDKTEKNIEKVELAILKVLLSEFEYNLSQQVYVSDDLWNMIILSKNKTITVLSSIKKSLKSHAKGQDFFDAFKLILETQEVTASKVALNYLKQEVRSI